ncbi:hypothetical protein COO59_05840 [Mixta theicola]|uniref:AroM protein n=1 Tax=Mixta theicola TaxID=1458355 RepID=A0A2K1QC85_9GAMM|nr:AroM family protein [Mixta theicola]PNS12641.1 hypothetical protein COO59_05840 [Mixta theicola]GLR10207.1 hypothetical protein GCM10007905_29270 [Mixta theicola]
MKQTLVILTIAHSPDDDITPLLLETLTEEQLEPVSLLNGLTSEEITEKYAPRKDEKTLVVRLADGAERLLATSRIERGLQRLINQLETRGVENILLLGCGPFTALQSRSAVLMEPDRLIPPLISAIVGNHQAGIMVSADELLRQQAGKWRSLSKPASFAVANPFQSDNQALIDAGLLLLEQGADVVVLDGPGYHPSHCDLLQQLLGIPVLLSWRLLAKMAAELLA